jgi:pimeloyl-ACP methyl ester carboxylesterase
MFRVLGVGHGGCTYRDAMATRDTLGRLLGPLLHEVRHSPSVCLSALRAHLGVGAVADIGGDDVERAAADAPPVLVLGGFLSHPFHYAPFESMLARLGYEVHHDAAVNCRRFRSHVDRLVARVDAICARAGKPLRIVGHSLGGLQAMALLAQRPDAVTHVVAVASPVAGGTPWQPLQRAAERVLGVRARDTRLLRRLIEPYAARITTISTPHDPIAPPRVCAVAGAGNVVLSTVTAADRAVASHVGVIFMPSALRVIVRSLLRPCAPTTVVRRAG